MFLGENVIQIAQRNLEHGSFKKWGHPALEGLKAGPHFIKEPHDSKTVVSTWAALRITFVPL